MEGVKRSKELTLTATGSYTSCGIHYNSFG